MESFIIGALVVTCLFMIFDYSRRRNIKVTILQWIVTLLAFGYLAFVLLVIVSFLQEKSPQAALVMGLFFGFFAIVWFVLLYRFIFSKKQDTNNPPGKISLEEK